VGNHWNTPNTRSIYRHRYESGWGKASERF